VGVALNAIVKARGGRPLFIRRPNHWRRRNHKETVELTRQEKDDPTDLEELTSWASRIIIFGGLAVGIIIIGLVVLAVWAFSATPT
jgi:hypothetical protein